jgi:hypothetical protein
MTVTQCEHELSVARAIASGSWPAPIAAHVAACPACADVALVAGALRTEARLAAAETAPDPGAIWRAVLRDRRRRALERANLPITVMTRVALGACTVAALAGLVWMWPAVADQFAAFARSLTAPAAPTPDGATLALFSGAVVATLSAALALFESWAGD